MRLAERAEEMAERHAAQAQTHADIAQASALMAMESVLQSLDNIPMPNEARAEARRELEREIAETRERFEVSSNAVTAPTTQSLPAAVARIAFRLDFGSAKREVAVQRANLQSQTVSAVAEQCQDDEVAPARIA